MSLTLLAVGPLAAASAGALGAGFEVRELPDLTSAADHDAVLIAAPDLESLAVLVRWRALPQAAFDTAVVVAVGVADSALEAELLTLGVEAVVPASPPQELARQLRHAVLRKRVERTARTAYATDLATGLPHEMQLLEHMTQLVALRERDPAPMALIALRVEGYAQAAARLGGEAGNVLRRKVAVRLRSALRASDVVATIGREMFGVLLGHLDAKADAERVATKLMHSLQQPIVVAGHPCRVAASFGLALYPEHGKDAATLVRWAVAQAGGDAASAVAVPTAATTKEGLRPGQAANDETP